MVAGIRGIRGRTDPIAFVTFPHVPLANSHLTAASIIAVAALLGTGVAWLIYRRRLAVPGLQPANAVLGEGVYLGHAYGIAAARGLVPAATALGWTDERLIDGAGDLVADSVAYAGRPRHWQPDLPLRQLALGVLAGAFLLAVLTIVLAGLFRTTA